MNSQNSLFPYDKEELLRSLERFDGEITAEDVIDSGKCDNSRYIHTTFLEVLLEFVCGSIVKKDSQKELLLAELCKRLSQTNLINEELLLHTLPLRKQLSKMFFDYVKQICGEVIPDSEFDFSNILYLEESSKSFDNVYKTYFEELQEIGRGGFGIVCKAKFKMTDTLYAVKKIFFIYKNDSRLRRVIREAKNIAALNHPNVVHYNNAWTEAPSPEDDFDYSSSDDSNSYFTQDNVDSVKISVHSEDLSTITFEELGSGSSGSTYFSRLENIKVQRSMLNKLKKTSFDENSSSVIFRESISSRNVAWSVGSNIENDECDSHDADSGESDVSVNLNVKAILYIQMEYCDCDLRHWLNERATKNSLPFEMDVTEIFMNILNGVAHIHSKGIIHRDLKPQNIFYSESGNILKIGDFGLATLSGCSEDVSSNGISNLHSTNIGTLPYAAPEQIKYQSYNSKVDIYSLGIILIELLNTFSTMMELTKAIDEIKKGNFPNEMESPKLIYLVKNLVNENPEHRMSAKEILNYLQEDSRLTLEEREMAVREKEILLNKKEMELRQKEDALNEKDEEIARLKALINELQKVHLEK